MLADTVEYIRRLLFDISYERDIQEAMMFYLFYLGVQWYSMVGFGIMADNSHSPFWGLLGILSPYLLNTALAIYTVVKKNLHDSFSIFLVGFTIVGAMLGPGIALLPVVILSTMWDNSPEGVIKRLQKEQLEHDIEIERKLWAERSKRRIEEMLNINNYKSKG